MTASRETRFELRPELGTHPLPVPIRATLGLIGVGAVASAALFKPRRLKWLLGGTGALAVVRAVYGKPFTYLARLAFTPVLSLDKTIELDASASEVYRFWTDFTNFQRFMSFIEDVTINDEGGLRWSLRGPGGSMFQWDAWLTLLVPDRWIAWRSEKNSVISHEGTVEIIELEPNRTKVRVKLAWAPPAGILGSTIARFIGFDPRAVFDQDLEKMKELIEAPANSAHPRLQGAS